MTINICMGKAESTIEEIITEGELGALVVALCATLYDNGIRHVHVGGLLRMLGVDTEQAERHDDEMFLLDEDFYEKIEELGYMELDDIEVDTEDVTIH